MRQPKEYDDNAEGICLLKKEFYGLKQSPRTWNMKIVEILNSFDFRQLKSDTSGFAKKTPTEFIWIAVFLDDCLIVGITLENDIARKYKIKILGNTKKIIAMQWTRKE